MLSLTVILNLSQMGADYLITILLLRAINKMLKPKRPLRKVINKKLPLLYFFAKFQPLSCNISHMRPSLHGEQGWRSGDSTCLPPIWPGFDSRTRCHSWAEFVDTLLCSERFFPGVLCFPPYIKTII